MSSQLTHTHTHKQISQVSVSCFSIFSLSLLLQSSSRPALDFCKCFSPRARLSSNIPKPPHSKQTQISIIFSAARHAPFFHADLFTVPRPLWPLPKPQRRLPILVLFHGFEQNNNNSDDNDDHDEGEMSHKANSLKHLSTCRATNSIVVTFNYRIGLLGE